MKLFWESKRAVIFPCIQCEVHIILVLYQCFRDTNKHTVLVNLTACW